VVIPYYPLSESMLGRVVRLQLERIRERIARNHNVPFSYDDAAVSLIIARCTELESGGRMIDAILTNTILPEISHAYLARTLEGESLGEVRLSAEGGEFRFGYGVVAVTAS